MPKITNDKIVTTKEMNAEMNRHWNLTDNESESKSQNRKRAIVYVLGSSTVDYYSVVRWVKVADVNLI